MALYSRDEERPDGSCRYLVYGRLGKGRNARQITRHFATAAERDAVRAQLEAEAVLGLHRPAATDETMTFADYLSQVWWPDHVLGGISKALAPSTQADYKLRVRKYVLPFLGGYTLAQISENDELAEAWVRWMREEQRAGTPTVAKTVQVVSGAARRARRRGLTVNPFADLEIDHDLVHDHLEPVADPVMVERLRWLFLNDPKSSEWVRNRNATILDLAYGLGMRQQEIYAISWPTVLNVDGDIGDWWYLHESLSARELRKHQMKSKAGVRNLRVFEPIRLRVRAWWELNGRPTDGLVVATEEGTPEHRQNWRQRQWMRMFKLAGQLDRPVLLHPKGLDYYNPHQLRHVNTDILTRAHWPQSDVMDQLGWGEVRMIERYRQRSKQFRGQPAISPADQISAAAEIVAEEMAGAQFVEEK